MQKLLFTIFLLISGILCGYFCQIAAKRGGQRYVDALPRFRKLLLQISMLGIMPISFVGVIWVIPFSDVRIILLPLVGATTLLLGGVLGLIAAHMLGKKGPQKAVLFCCGSFSNIGSIGGLASFLFFGETGFALLALFKLFEEIVYFGIGFPVARYLKDTDANLRIGERISQIFRDPFLMVVMMAFPLGFILNFSGIPRPHGYEMLNNLFVPLGIFLILMSIGVGLHFSNIRSHLPVALVVSLIKFCLMPLFAGFFAWLLGFHEIEDGLPLKIVLLASSMPVAFNAIVAASLYDLDLDMANTCWLFTTAALVLVLPLLSFLFSIL